MFAGLISPADDKARMDARFDVEDDDAGLRAARHLGPRNCHRQSAHRGHQQIRQSQVAARGGACGWPARSRLYVQPHPILRRADKITEAAQWMLAAPHEAEQLGDLDQWWVERRVITRKLLDLNDFKSAYEVANGAARRPMRISAPNSNSPQAGSRCAFSTNRHGDAPFRPHRRGRHQSHHAGPLVLLAGPRRGGLGRGQEARGYYEAAAQYPTAYYGQIAARGSALTK